MIDLNDIKRIYKEDGRVKNTWYRCYCDTCGVDRGYKSKQAGNKNKRCRSCSRENMFTGQVREKMSKAKLGRAPHNKGKKGVSQDTSRKMALKKIGRSPSNKGTPCSLETKIKISNTLTGKSVFEGFKKETQKRNIIHKIKNTLRSRLCCAIRNKHKGGSAIKDLGCSISDFKIYIEQLFQPGMTWDNWSKTGWHLDHIIPLSSVDLTNPDAIKIVCNYKNIKPVWASENIEKQHIKIPDRDLSGKTLLIVAGPSGSGKTTLLKKLDINPKKYDDHWYGLLDLEYENLDYIDTPCRVQFLISAFKQMKAKVVSVYLEVDLETLKSNINNRAGRNDKVDARYKRFQSMKNKGIFDFCGDYDSCFNYISSFKQTITTRAGT